MTSYRGGRRGGSVHSGVSRFAGPFTGRAGRLHFSTVETSWIAMEAKHMPNSGSTAAREAGLGRFKNKLYKDIRRKARGRAGGSVNEIMNRAYDKASAAMERIAELEWRGEVLAVAAALGSDIAAIGLEFVVLALNAIGDELFESYCETMYELWSAGEAKMNNGQVTITEEHYFPEITDFLAEQMEMDGDGSTRWPFETNTYEYYDRVAFEYDGDVFYRAFTDTAESPLAPCEEIREQAMAAKAIAGALSFF